MDNDAVFNNGLTTSDANKKNLEQGDNLLSMKVSTPWWLKLLHEWTSPFAMMLWVGALLCFLAFILDNSDPSNLYLGFVLAGVVMLSGTFSFFQIAKSESVMEGFKNFIPPKCKVIRDGKEDMINAAKLVRGDIVVLFEGGRVPADIRVIESKT